MDNAEKTKWARLGDYIEQCDERAGDSYSVDDVVGISTAKSFIATKANMDGVSLNSYKVVKPHEFAYVADTSRRGDKIALALNSLEKAVLVSSIYTAFRSIDENVLLPEYLFMLLNRTEFDRFARFNSWGSARETFDWSEMCRIEIPLPDIEIQREIVEAYNGLKTIAEQNEALAEKISAACHACIVDCRAKYSAVPLGDYITESDERNTDLSITLSQGISNLKEFQAPKQVAQYSKSDKIVRRGYFGYNRATTRNGEKISIAYYYCPLNHKKSSPTS